MDYNPVGLREELPGGTESAGSKYVGRLVRNGHVFHCADCATGGRRHLVEHAQAMAEQAGVPYLLLRGVHSKQKLIFDLLRQRPMSEGLVAVLCTMENVPHRQAAG